MHLLATLEIVFAAQHCHDNSAENAMLLCFVSQPRGQSKAFLFRLIFNSNLFPLVIASQESLLRLLS